MFGHKFARAFLVSTAIVGTGFGLPAFAQTFPDTPIPPDRQVVDINNVNLAGGFLNIADVAATIGSAAHGASYRRVSIGSGWSDNTRYALYQGTTSSVMIAQIGGTALTFDLSGTTWVNRDAEGATLVSGGSGAYTLTLRDGTVVQFTNSYFNLSADVFVFFRLGTKAVASTVRRPNGEMLSFSYLQNSSGGGGRGGRVNSRLRVQGIKSSNGYAIKLSYVSDVWAGTADWFTVANAKLVNLGNEYCDVSANSCTLTGSWPSVAFGQSTSGSNTVYTTTDSLGRVTQYTFDSAFRPIAIRRPNSTTDDEAVVYDTNGRIASVTVDGRTWTYVFSLSGTTMTATITNPDTSQRVVTSDTTVGLPTSIKDELNRTTIFTYDTNGRLLTTTRPEGNQFKNTYDARGNVIERRAVAKPGSGIADVVASASYDATCSNPVTCNKPNTTTDPKSNVTNYTYDSGHGGVLTVTAPAATTGGVRPQTRYSYSSFQAYYNNGSGIVASGQPTALLTGTSTCAASVSCSGGAGETKTTIAYGPQTTGTANNLLPVSTTAAAGDGSVSAVSAYGYDAIGNMTSEDGPAAGTADTTTYRFDADREQTGVILADPDGAGPLKRRAVKTTFGADGLITKAEVGTVTGTDDTAWAAFASLQQVTPSYDASDRKTQDVVTAGGTTYSVTQYSYDTNGRLDCTAVRMNPAIFGSPPTSACTLGTAGSAGPDRISRRSYDGAGEATKITTGYGTPDQADAQSVTYTNNGLIATTSDGQGNKTSFTYDGLDRPTTTNFPSLTTGSGTSSATDYMQVAYDANSNIISRRLRDGTTLTLGYDNLNRLNARSFSNGEPSLSYSYDLLGRPATIAKTGSTLTFAFDALSRMTTATQPFGTLTYQYDAAGNRTRVTWGDGFYASYDYDNVGNMLAVRENGAASGAGVLATYAYDDLGRRTSITRGNGVTTGYTFDPASRLSSLSMHLTGTAKDQSTTFGYNPASQITSVTRSNDAYAWNGAVDVNRAYVSNGLNQYSTAGGTSFGYDGRGNLTSSGSTTYGYSADNLLTSMSGGITLSYDPIGRLSEYDTSSSTRFVYDGGEIAAEVANPSGSILRRYVTGANPDEPLVWYEGSGTTDRRWLLSDERGSIVSVTDGSGNALATNSYDESGIPGSGNLGRFQYTGQAWFPELGMSYYKARFYSPGLGRFMQTDPLGYKDGLNWYNYVHNDPINSRDPTGKLSIYCTTTVSFTYDNPFFPGSSYTTTETSCEYYSDPGDFNPGGGDPWGGGGGGNGGSPAQPPAAPPAPPTNKPCQSSESFAGQVAEAADKASNTLDTVALVSGVAAVATSETGVGGAFFGGVAAEAKLGSAVSTIVAVGAKVVDGNYRGALASGLGFAIGQGTAKAMLGISKGPNYGGEQSEKFNESASEAGGAGAQKAVEAAICE